MEKTYGFDDVSNESFLIFDCTNKKLSELVVGDLLMGADSQPVEVLSIRIIEEPNYLVTPVKGDPYIVGESHTLAVNMSAASYIGKDGECYRANYLDNENVTFRSKRFNFSNFDSKELAYAAAEVFLKNLEIIKNISIAVKDYLSKNKTFKHQTKGYRVSLDFQDAELGICPYIIGSWLGDGISRDPNIASVDREIIDYYTEYFKPFGLVVKPTNKVGVNFGVTTEVNFGPKNSNFFRTYLRENNLKDNKHIPLKFLRNSREKRLKLLAGLLDTDGSLDDGNSFDFIQKREHLLDQFVFLCRSLGFSCYKSECEKTCTNSSRGRVTGTYYRTCVSGEGLEQIPTLLKRKQAMPREQVKDALVTGITLKQIGTFQNYRITTDKKLFLMSDLTVRHTYIPKLNLLKK